MIRTDIPAAVGGSLLAAATRVASAARPPAKPLHPRGDVVTGVLRRRDDTEPSGVAWLDEPGEDRVLVRLSRAVGLPDPWPDIHGLALRIPVSTGYADLLLATTGLGRVTRFVLTPARRREGRPYTTLLPYRGPDGPLLLGAVAAGEDRFRLSWAGASGPWVPFADLALQPTPAPDEPVSFDPVEHVLPGLDHYSWVRRLREPSYRTARQSSGRTA